MSEEKKFLDNVELDDEMLDAVAGGLTEQEALESMRKKMLGEECPYL